MAPEHIGSIAARLIALYDRRARMARKPAAGSDLDAPLPERLPFDVQVTSLRDVAVALCELAYLTDRAAAVQADLDDKIRKLKSEAERELVDVVENQPVTFAERTKALRDAVVAFAEANPDEICLAGKKTRQFTHGKIQLRELPETVEPRAGFEWVHVLEAAADDDRYHRLFVKVREELDKQALIKAAREGHLETADLKELHVKIVPPRDQASVKLERYACIPPSVA